jgi:hypothetical protein
VAASFSVKKFRKTPNCYSTKAYISFPLLTADFVEMQGSMMIENHCKLVVKYSIGCYVFDPIGNVANLSSMEPREEEARCNFCFL